MLHIHHSNRLELLRDSLLQWLGGADADVFTAEQIIVPGAALRRWLSLGLADARGICANVHFGFLAQWLWRRIARVVPGVDDESPFAAAVLAWRVHAAFADADFVAGHVRLQSFLRDADALMRYELACEVAALLEQYVTYRADWLQAWREGRDADFGAGPPAPRHEDAAWQAAQHHEDAAWQAALWRRIEAELGLRAAHPAQAFLDALQRGGADAARRAGLPARLHLFALPAIAPLNLRLLQQLSRWIDVHVYVLNPCREFWFDLIDARRLGWLAAHGRERGAAEEGNRLLAAWGTQAQVHIEQLVEAGGEGAVDDAAFAPAPGTSLLAQLQNALLELRPIEAGSLTLAEGDRSIELHVCHSLVRELEVLHDHLLGLFAADAGLRPGDIAVVTPDLDAAAPLIDAVFGTVPRERALPYALCGARRGGADALARCLLALLALAGSRCSASGVFGLLQQPPVARRFGLDDDALARVHEGLRDAGFHWALDTAQRARLELPATPRHTLDHALQRLFLGYALPSACDRPFDGQLGAGDAEGTDALALGALWRYAQALRRAVDALQQPRLPEAWAALLSELIDEFVAPSDAELDELRELRRTLRELAEDMRRGVLPATGQPLPLPVVRSALLQRLDDAGGSGGAAGGSINFASIGSLRGLPFAVVCAIGMNDGAFPTPQRSAEFDLMALHPRRGDRQRRSDQRGAMLDLLLAARRSLYLSCSGRSQRDNTPLPPSVLVAELRDLLQRAVAADADDAQALQQALRRLVVEHPLQPFAQAAFDVHADARLRSFDAELAEALRRGAVAPPAAAQQVLPTLQDEEEDDAAIDAAPGAPFFAAPLPPPGPEWHQVTLERLQQFFRNPCRVLLRRRLGLELAHAAEELQDDEALLPDPAARRALGQRLLPLLLAGADPQTLPALARAGSEWPDGSLGEVELQAELQALQQFAQCVREALAEPLLAPCSLQLDVELAGEPWQLQAAFADLRACGLLRWRHGRTRPADYLDAWLQHLALCAAAPPGVTLHTRWLSTDGEFGFEPCLDAVSRLRELLVLYRRGLQRPLRFFARAALTLIDDGLDAARAAWQPSSHRPFAEGADPACQLALRGIDDPLDEEFQQLAAAVWLPLLDHLRDARR